MNRIRRAIRKIRTLIFKGALIHNPVLTQAIGICPIIGIAASIRDALALSITLGAVLVFAECMTAVFLKRIPRWIRVAFYALSSSGIIYLASPFILPFTEKGTGSLSLYICIVCVNALVTVRCERFACKKKLRYSIVDALASALGFAAVALIVGAIRELIAYGSFSATDIRIPNGTLPFVAFALLGFLAAAHKAFVTKFYPEEKVDTFTLTGCDKKPVFKDPGLTRKRATAVKAAASADDSLVIRARYESDDSTEAERQENNNA